MLISDFVYMKDKKGRAYGWGVAEYSTPERFMGSDFTQKVYDVTPEESRRKVLAHLRGLMPEVEREAWEKFLK